MSRVSRARAGVGAFLATAGVATLGTGLALVAGSSAQAADEFDKVYVCKYSTTPGDGEILKPGKNPIETSISTIEGFTGIFPFAFADAQGKSVAIGPAGDGFPELGVADCVLPTEEPSEEPRETETPVVVVPGPVDAPPTDAATETPSADSPPVVTGGGIAATAEAVAVPTTVDAGLVAPSSTSSARATAGAAMGVLGGLMTVAGLLLAMSSRRRGAHRI